MRPMRSLQTIVIGLLLAVATGQILAGIRLNAPRIEQLGWHSYFIIEHQNTPTGYLEAIGAHAALSLRAGGVGYYPGSQFVHVDVGPVRSWCNCASMSLA